ncbi:MAG: WGR domain-containing protein [Nitratireductor sp.]|uniref:WGR domain-containing protein n=1 Tax=Nitratireductor sp. TaxID=1872084 RepID=UPI002611DBFD|nr:WGR domain-containing protein [Nitratireductor sp.]MCV0349691.1 WGR domain-containing protein [Nitratireductor sp.]
MATNPHLCCLKRIDPARNMARYYTLSVEPTLFGDAALVRQWGRIGTRGQFKINLFDTTGAAEIALQRLRRIKEKRGYHPEMS